MFPCGMGFDSENAPHEVSKSRRILPQVLYSFVPEMLTEYFRYILTLIPYDSSYAVLHSFYSLGIWVWC